MVKWVISLLFQGGCVLLASDGVCVLSNLNELKNDQVEELENGMNIWGWDFYYIVWLSKIEQFIEKQEMCNKE
jgi:hypothetical protein